MSHIECPTSFAGILPLMNFLTGLQLMNLMAETFDREKHSGFARVKLCLLYLLAKLMGVARISHLCIVGSLVASVIGLERLPDQSTLYRNLRELSSEQAKEFFNKALQAVIKAGYLRNVRVVAVDAHHIPYYGKKVKAKKGFSSSKGRALPGYKVYVVTDIGSNLTLAYEVAPADADDRKMLSMLLRRLRRILDFRALHYLLIDRGFFSGALLNKLNKDVKLRFIIPAKKTRRIMAQIDKLVKRDLEVLNGGKVVGARGSITQYEEDIRLLVEKAPDNKGYWCYLSNDKKARPSTLVRQYRQRWRVENVIEELKDDFYLDKLPSGEPDLIEIHVCFTVVAYNIMRSYNMELGGEHVTAEAGTTRNRCICLEGIVKKVGKTLMVIVEATGRVAKVIKKVWNKMGYEARPWSRGRLILSRA